MERGLARLLIFLGLGLVLIGIALLLAPQIPFLGRLPGDLRFSRGPWTISIPLVTCLVLSLLLTLILSWVSRR